MKKIFLVITHLFNKKIVLTKSQRTMTMWYAVGVIRRVGRHDI